MKLTARNTDSVQPSGTIERRRSALIRDDFNDPALVADMEKALLRARTLHLCKDIQIGAPVPHIFPKSACRGNPRERVAFPAVFKPRPSCQSCQATPDILRRICWSE